MGDYDSKTGMLTIHQKKDRHKPMVQYARLGKIGAEAYAQLAAGKKKCALLCMDTKGTPMTNVAYWFGPAMRAARIKDYTWHDNRRTACSRWVMGSMPLAAVAKYAGHSTIQMTMRYSHLVPKVNQAAAGAMDAFYLGGVETETDTRTDTGTTSSFPQARKLL